MNIPTQSVRSAVLRPAFPALLAASLLMATAGCGGSSNTDSGSTTSGGTTTTGGTTTSGGTTDTGGATTTPPAATTIQAVDAANACAAIAGTTIAASAIGLSTQGATITSAALQAASGSTPEYCKVLGSILAANAADPSIKFEVNLPTSWNIKALQFGGGGFNGTVVTGLGNVTSALSGSQTPLAQGYMTFGGDSGHQGSNGTFGTNAQALANYGGESVKRTHDVAVYLATAYYKTAPRRMYYHGGSKGGHEGLVAAQRYGSDYDGVVAFYPANQNQAMVLSWYRQWSAAYETTGGALNSAKQALLKTKVLEACDALDGVTDGLVSDTNACRSTFAVNSLRCPGGADTGDTCLSDVQTSTLLTSATDMVFAFPLANGVTSIGPYPVFEAGDIGTLFDATGANGTATGYYGFNDPVIRYFIQQDASSSSLKFDYRAWQPRVQQISALYDATDPNLDAFKGKGSKLLLVQGTTDMLVTHYTTSAYYDNVAKRYGGDATKAFLRYYVIPGFGHGSGTFGMTWDSLSALDAWVESGTAPANPVTVDSTTATKGRTRPMCEYPLYPKYKGSGDINSADNFSCAAS